MGSANCFIWEDSLVERVIKQSMMMDNISDDGCQQYKASVKTRSSIKLSIN